MLYTESLLEWLNQQIFQIKVFCFRFEFSTLEYFQLKKKEFFNLSELNDVHKLYDESFENFLEDNWISQCQPAINIEKEHLLGHAMPNTIINLNENTIRIQGSQNS